MKLSIESISGTSVSRHRSTNFSHSWKFEIKEEKFAVVVIRKVYFLFNR